jgi:hypothetical protein
LLKGITLIKILCLLLLVLLPVQGFCAVDSQLLKTMDIQRGLFSDSYQSFDIEEQSVAYLLQENTTAITRGVAVMLGDSTQSVAADEGFLPLAKELNKLGWVTILLPAPETAFNPTASPINSDTPNLTQAAVADDEITTQTPGAETTSQDPLTEDWDINKQAVTGIYQEAFDQHELQVVALLQAAAEKSQEYPGFFLVISKGTSAAWLSKIYTEQTLGPPDALVVVSPYWPDRNFNQQLPDWIANTPMPLLDIYNEWDNKWANETVEARKISAIKALKMQYRQRQLIGAATNQQQSIYMGKVIYGWLSHMGW